jgi:ferredoxin
MNSCPNSAFELSSNGHRCKPKDALVRNSEALESYREKVEGSAGPLSIAIRFQIPECLLCWQCIGACPHKAIGMESDTVETREYVIESPQRSFW